MDAPKERVEQKDDLVEHPDADARGEKAETGRGDRDEKGGEGKKKVKRRRRHPKGLDLQRLYEVRMGQKRIYADGAEVSHGCLTYWVDNVMTSMPLKRKVDIITRAEVSAPVMRRPMIHALAPAMDEAKRQRENEAHAAAMRAELEAEMGV